MDGVDTRDNYFRRANLKKLRGIAQALADSLADLAQHLEILEREGLDTPPPAKNVSEGIPEAPGGPGERR